MSKYNCPNCGEPSENSTETGPFRVVCPNDECRIVVWEVN